MNWTLDLYCWRKIFELSLNINFVWGGLYWSKFSQQYGTTSCSWFQPILLFSAVTELTKCFLLIGYMLWDSYLSS